MPEDETLSFLLVYPDPPFIILISDRVFFGSVANFWIPAVPIVVNPTVLMPDR